MEIIEYYKAISVVTTACRSNYKMQSTRYDKGFVFSIISVIVHVPSVDFFFRVFFSTVDSPEPSVKSGSIFFFGTLFVFIGGTSLDLSSSPNRMLVLTTIASLRAVLIIIILKLNFAVYIIYIHYHIHI